MAVIRKPVSSKETSEDWCIYGSPAATELPSSPSCARAGERVVFMSRTVRDEAFPQAYTFPGRPLCGSVHGLAQMICNRQFRCLY